VAVYLALRVAPGGPLATRPRGGGRHRAGRGPGAEEGRGGDEPEAGQGGAGGGDDLRQLAARPASRLRSCAPGERPGCVCRLLWPALAGRAATAAGPGQAEP